MSKSITVSITFTCGDKEVISELPQITADKLSKLPTRISDIFNRVAKQPLSQQSTNPVQQKKGEK